MVGARSGVTAVGMESAGGSGCVLKVASAGFVEWLGCRCEGK